MRISVVIPVRNEARFIGRAIRTAWAAGADEVLVVDGGSTDGSQDIARTSGTGVLDSEPGRAIQQNAGAAAATGDVLLFQHADTWLAAGACRQVHSALTRPNVVGGAFRQRIEAEGRSYRWLEWGNELRVRWFGLPYGDQGIFLRRGEFERCGGFPTVRLLEDVMLMQRLRSRSRPLLLPGPIHVSPRRWQRNGVLRQTLTNWWLLAAYSAGVSPDRLAAYYQPHDTSGGWG